MALTSAQEKFRQILNDLNESEIYAFFNWIRNCWNPDQIKKLDSTEEVVLKCIAGDIRRALPLSAILPTETIITPLVGPNSDCDPKTTVHMDEFLYDDKLIDELVDKGKLSRYYCKKCFSKDVKLLKFISHSMSISRIMFLFKSLLPPLNNEETILDIGSRLGGVLYGAYLMTSASKIIGVELNSEFCRIQKDMIKKYHFNNRIEIVCNNIFNRTDLLSSADVVIINNVFEFFSNANECINSWRLLSMNLKIGCTIVTIPHLCDTFTHYEMGFQWSDWVEELPVHSGWSGCDCLEEWDEHQTEMQRYRVKKKIDINLIK